MRRPIGITLLAFGIVATSMSGQARADAFINPWGGLVFGNDQTKTGFRAMGVTFGDAGHGLVGTETTIGISPGFFGDAVENYILDLMAGFTIGPTLRAKTHHDTRVFGIIEFGTIRTSIDGIGTGAAFARNDLGLELGGGTTIALTDSLLFRAELRHIQTFRTSDAPNSLNAKLDDFHYWRTAFGITLH